ncbi:hypothetical protein M404DRAFT_999371 [Pisolithus tinctorius Marx 270]|uniref:Uncharacterized protein n=1 Tax=Pisolithus tinctorius Marx 270 TaxID=870435 RepID=A0A0C3JAQ9_PISTI|nr:hypothetical protein M404DRAFT_999371 [Pisolithus tinctorius Marx 270]
MSLAMLIDEAVATRYEHRKSALYSKEGRAYLNTCQTRCCSKVSKLIQRTCVPEAPIG